MSEPLRGFDLQEYPQSICINGGFEDGLALQELADLSQPSPFHIGGGYIPISDRLPCHG